MLRRLNAFTLLELVVVMAVSAILFAMTYAALRLVQRQQVAVERRTAALGQLSTWQDVLGADFQKADLVEATGDELRCQRRAAHHLRLPRLHPRTPAGGGPRHFFAARPATCVLLARPAPHYGPS
jgi:prepilin-type N-terminal cleavage/methylation domain-containing protein